jgi:hypothetical protein
MAVSATGPLAPAVQSMVTLLSLSSTFQTLCGVDNETDALAYINQSAQEDEDLDALTYPAAVVALSSGGVDHMSIDGWMLAWPLEVALELETPDAYKTTRSDAHMWFLNAVGGILTDIATTINNSVGTANSYLNIERIDCEDIAEGLPRENNGKHLWGVGLIVRWRGSLL